MLVYDCNCNGHTYIWHYIADAQDKWYADVDNILQMLLQQ